MKKKIMRLTTGMLVLSLSVTNFAGISPAYAKNTGIPEMKVQTEVEERVLVVTSDMLDENGRLVIRGDWDRIEVPKEVEASRIYLEGVTAGKVEIESGNKSVIEMVSGEIGEVSVIPAKLQEVKITDLPDLLKSPETVNLAIKMYKESLAKNERLLNNRPKVITRGDVKVAEVKVSGNVKLDFGKGSVGNVKVDADGSLKKLSVDISNFNGDVAVSQKDRKDGRWMVARVRLNNSKVENLTLEGEGNGNIVLAGQNSEVKEAKFEKTPYASLNVKTEALEVSKETSNATIKVLDKVDKIKVEGNNAKIEVGQCGSVKDAEIKGDNVNIGGNGSLEKVDIEGKGAYVSTSGTDVKGENTYVPPVVAPPTPEPVVSPSENEKNELTLKIDTFQNLDSIYREYETVHGHTGVLKYDSECLFGTFTWSRELTEEEIAGGMHSSTLYDVNGSTIQLPETFNLYSGMFAAKLPEDFASGTYTYEINWYIDGKEISDTHTFVYVKAEPTYTYMEKEDGTLTITKVVTNGVTAITVPEKIDGMTVTEIGSGAFDASTEEITSLTLPNTLETINAYALFGCVHIETLNIPASVTSLSAYMLDSPMDTDAELDIMAVHVDSENQNYCSVNGVVFSKDMKTLYYIPKCYKTEHYVIPEGVESALQCSTMRMKSLTLPASLTSLELSGGKALEEYIVTEGNTIYSAMEGVLFEGATLKGVPAGNNRTTYAVPDSVTAIGGIAFANCKNLVTITIPETVTSIGSGAFEGCRALTSIELPSEAVIVNGFTFSGCSSLTSVVLPGSMTTLPHYAFSGCVALEAIEIPSDVVTVDTFAFNGCKALKKITIPDKVTAIKAGAFRNCISLTTVVIPKSVTEIGASVFAGNTDVTIYTTEGSVADTYAQKNGISVQYQ